MLGVLESGLINMNVITRGIRNAYRNQIRTFSIVFILGLSIALALSMVMARQAVGNKIAEVKNSIGNIITISPAGIRGFEGGGELLTKEKIDEVAVLPHVEKVSTTLQDRLDSDNTSLVSAIEAGSFGTRVRQFNVGTDRIPPSGNGVFSPPMMVVGTNDPSNLQAVGGGAIKLSSGELFTTGSNENAALIGSSLAEKNNLSVGSTFKAYDQDVTVKGIFTTDTQDRFSQNLVVFPIETLQTLSGQEGVVSSAIVQIDSIDNMSASLSAIQTTMGDVADVISQQDTSSEALAPLENVQKISLVSMVGALGAGAVIIFLTMLMIVRERRREIAVLKALGGFNTSIVTQFVVEALTLTMIALVVGFGLGAFGSNKITKVLLTTSTSSANTVVVNVNGAMPPQGGPGGPGGFIRGGFGRIAESVGLSINDIQTSIGFDIIFYGFLAAILIAVVGSVIPAWLIANIRPAEVLRSE